MTYECVSVVFLQIISGDTAEKLVSNWVKYYTYLARTSTVTVAMEVLYTQVCDSHTNTVFVQACNIPVPCNDGSKGIWHTKTAPPLFVVEVIK